MIIHLEPTTYNVKDGSNIIGTLKQDGDKWLLTVDDDTTVFKNPDAALAYVNENLGGGCLSCG